MAGKLTRLPCGLLIAALAVCTTLPLSAHEFTFDLGRKGWVLEHFGTDVTILRTAPDKSSSAAANLILSCASDDRRLRLALPQVSGKALPTGATTGSLLFRVAGSPRGPAAIMRFGLSEGTTFSVSSVGHAQQGDAILAVGRLLLAQPRRLDLLFFLGSSPRPLQQSTAYRLSLTFGPADAAVFRDFVNVCSRHGGQLG